MDGTDPPAPHRDAIYVHCEQAIKPETTIERGIYLGWELSKGGIFTVEVVAEMLNTSKRQARRYLEAASHVLPVRDERKPVWFRMEDDE